MFDADATDHALEAGRKLREASIGAVVVDMSTIGGDPADLGPDTMRDVVDRLSKVSRPFGRLVLEADLVR